MNPPSYLSRTLRTLSVEQKCPCGAILLMWIKIAPHDKQFCLSCGAILSCGAMTNCSTSAMWSNLSLLHMNLQYMLPYCDLRCFDAKSILSRFTHFCVEQNLTQTSCPWSKNDKFHVCSKVISLLDGSLMSKSKMPCS